MKFLKPVTALILIAAIIFAGCKSKTPKELIVKKWKMTEVSGGMSARMPDSLRKQLVKNMSLEFFTDNKYVLTGIDTSTHKGSYTLSDDGKTLTITPEATGKPEKNIIEELSGSKLIFADNFGTRLVAVSR